MDAYKSDELKALKSIAESLKQIAASLKEVIDHEGRVVVKVNE